MCTGPIEIEHVDVGMGEDFFIEFTGGTGASVMWDISSSAIEMISLNNCNIMEFIAQDFVTEDDIIISGIVNGEEYELTVDRIVGPTGHKNDKLSPDVKLKDYKAIYSEMPFHNTIGADGWFYVQIEPTNVCLKNVYLLENVGTQYYEFPKEFVEDKIGLVPLGPSIGGCNIWEDWGHVLRPIEFGKVNGIPTPAKITVEFGLEYLDGNHKILDPDGQVIPIKGEEFDRAGFCVTLNLTLSASVRRVAMELGHNNPCADFYEGEIENRKMGPFKLPPPTPTE